MSLYVMGYCSNVVQTYGYSEKVQTTLISDL